MCPCPLTLLLRLRHSPEGPVVGGVAGLVFGAVRTVVRTLVADVQLVVEGVVVQLFALPRH